MYMSDSSNSQRAGMKPKTIKWILVALSTTTLSNTNYTDLYDSSTSNYFLWSSQSGGYGTCEFAL